MPRRALTGALSESYVAPRSVHVDSDMYSELDPCCGAHAVGVLGSEEVPTANINMMMPTTLFWVDCRLQTHLPPTGARLCCTLTSTFERTTSIDMMTDMSHTPNYMMDYLKSGGVRQSKSAYLGSRHVRNNVFGGKPADALAWIGEARVRPMSNSLRYAYLASG